MIDNTKRVKGALALGGVDEYSIYRGVLKFQQVQVFSYRTLYDSRRIIPLNILLKALTLFSSQKIINDINIKIHLHGT